MVVILCDTLRAMHTLPPHGLWLKEYANLRQLMQSSFICWTASMFVSVRGNLKPTRSKPRAQERATRGRISINAQSSFRPACEVFAGLHIVHIYTCIAIRSVPMSTMTIITIMTIALYGGTEARTGQDGKTQVRGLCDPRGLSGPLLSWLSFPKQHAVQPTAVLTS